MSTGKTVDMCEYRPNVKVVLRKFAMAVKFIKSGKIVDHPFSCRFLIPPFFVIAVVVKFTHLQIDLKNAYKNR